MSCIGLPTMEPEAEPASFPERKRQKPDNARVRRVLGGSALAEQCTLPVFVPITKQEPTTTLLVQGARRLGHERRQERERYEKIVLRMRELFSQYPAGVDEHVLIERLMQGESVDRSTASSAADSLRTSGVAAKNWRTGKLTPQTRGSNFGSSA